MGKQIASRLRPVLSISFLLCIKSHGRAHPAAIEARRCFAISLKDSSTVPHGTAWSTGGVSPWDSPQHLGSLTRTCTAQVACAAPALPALDRQHWTPSTYLGLPPWVRSPIFSSGSVPKTHCSARGVPAALLMGLSQLQPSSPSPVNAHSVHLPCSWGGTHSFGYRRR